VREHSQGITLHPSSLARKGRGLRWRRRGFSGWLLASGGLGLGPLAGALIIELGAMLRLKEGLASLLLQVSRGGHVGVSLGGLVRQGGIVVGRV
jgi:hypothetical protein